MQTELFPISPRLDRLERSSSPPVGYYSAAEYKVVCLRETPVPTRLKQCDVPEKVAEYARHVVYDHPHYNSEAECMFVLFLNTRRHLKGHALLSIGTLDTLLVHPREVYRTAVMAAAAAIIVLHNHPSGDPSPSECDIKVTRDLIRAGQLLKIELLDHIIVGDPRRYTEPVRWWCSLRELGYFYT